MVTMRREGVEFIGMSEEAVSQRVGDSIGLEH